MTENTGSENTGNPAENAGNTQPAGDNTPAHWSAGISDAELKGWVENKGFHQKDVSEVAKSYRNLEKLMGAEKAGRTVEIPTNPDDQSQMDSFYNRLGRPESPDKYELAFPKEGGDEKFAAWAKGTFHKLGLTAKQAKALSEEWNGFVGGKATESVEAYQSSVATDEATLKKEWGAAYDNKIKTAKIAARQFVTGAGMDADVVDRLEDAMGYGNLMKFFSSIGEKIGEDNFVAGDTSAGFGTLTPGQAKSKLADLVGDKEFNARYLSGEPEALEKVRNLQKMIAAGGRAA